MPSAAATTGVALKGPAAPLAKPREHPVPPRPGPTPALPRSKNELWRDVWARSWGAGHWPGSRGAGRMASGGLTHGSLYGDRRRPRGRIWTRSLPPAPLPLADSRTLPATLVRSHGLTGRRPLATQDVTEKDSPGDFFRGAAGPRAPSPALLGHGALLCSPPQTPSGPEKLTPLRPKGPPLGSTQPPSGRRHQALGTRTTRDNDSPYFTGSSQELTEPTHAHENGGWRSGDGPRAPWLPALGLTGAAAGPPYRCRPLEARSRAGGPGCGTGRASGQGGRAACLGHHPTITSPASTSEIYRFTFFCSFLSRNPSHMEPRQGSSWGRGTEWPGQSGRWIPEPRPPNPCGPRSDRGLPG